MKTKDEFNQRLIKDLEAQVTDLRKTLETNGINSAQSYNKIRDHIEDMKNYSLRINSAPK